MTDPERPGWTAIGDSFSTAIGDTRGGWVDRTTRQLIDDGFIEQLDNLAEPYATIDTVVREQLPHLRPSVIGSAIAGANDLLRPHWDLRHVAAQVGVLLSSTSQNCSIVVTSTCPNFGVPRGRPGGRLAQRVTAINREVVDRANSDDKVVLVDAFALLDQTDLWAADGIHPSSAGHALLAESAIAALRPQLQRLRNNLQ